MMKSMFVCPFRVGEGVYPSDRPTGDQHMPTFIYAASLTDAQAVETPILTVEAEYGSTVVEGTLYTAAHHQPSGPFERGVNPAPCNDSRIPVVDKDAIVLVSHFDLDTAAGCLRALGGGFGHLFAPEYDPFWRLAEAVDLEGPHKARHLGGSEQDILRLLAYDAWAESELPRLPREGTHDVTEMVTAAGNTLTRVLTGDEAALDLGRKYMADEDKLNNESFETTYAGEIILRVVKDPRSFVNHLYTTPDGRLMKAVVTMNSGNQSITISLADPVPGLNCRELVQQLWGPEAGGHPGIAGSPRGQKMTGDQAEDVIREMLTRL